ncbi:MAG TPA: FMN-binding negative transcriptional regulator [Caulobacteraceae bacterium]|jgi:transcriptional regulator|nr:FMN-binding negative transcriptional regulator [Caulobacteraceae bacterium]
MNARAQRFAPRSASDIAALIGAFPLAWVVSPGGGPGASTLLPLLAETDETGRTVALFGHFARSTAQVAVLEADPRAQILFLGPNGYVSPRLVSKAGWAPTWNYAAVRFETEVRFHPEETEAAVWRLAQALESDHRPPWVPSRMGDRLKQLLPRIVAFRARVIEAHAVFKLGQDETDAVFEEIVEGLQDHPLAELMRAQADRGPPAPRPARPR